MARRTTNYIAVFTRAFRLAAVDGVNPSGSYAVARYEEMIETMNATAYRRTGSFIRLPGIGSSAATVKMVPISDGELLNATLQMDGPPQVEF